ncbi:MAG: hypothetical protein D6756_00290 [Cyanobacteria bacterium J083]|nr:MAG: hypothetical protein D6756_00290 [Cyanobacteria bacterium J083]
MSNIFRELLKKVGSGTHTGKNLTRSEAAEATIMMLQQIATPAQIGAFMLAHRIKRPTANELAGMLDAYDRLAPQFSLNIAENKYIPVIFGNPYDGRSRTAPVIHITALILATAGVPVIMHGGERMPTKYGMPLVDLWQTVNIDFRGFTPADSEACLAATNISFIYLPTYFPLHTELIPYREQIGKRPPFATLELIWSPLNPSEKIHIIAGFVHPPTEERFRETFALRGIEKFTTVKGLEGSCDLPISRTAIIGYQNKNSNFERLTLNPRDYNLGGSDIPLESPAILQAQVSQLLRGDNSPLRKTVIFNGGFYLWRCGVCADLPTGFTTVESMLQAKKLSGKLQQLRNFTQKIVANRLASS